MPSPDLPEDPLAYARMLKDVATTNPSDEEFQHVRDLMTLRICQVFGVSPEEILIGERGTSAELAKRMMDVWDRKRSEG